MDKIFDCEIDSFSSFSNLCSSITFCLNCLNKKNDELNYLYAYWSSMFSTIIRHKSLVYDKAVNNKFQNMLKLFHISKSSEIEDNYNVLAEIEKLLDNEYASYRSFELDAVIKSSKDTMLEISEVMSLSATLNDMMNTLFNIITIVVQKSGFKDENDVMSYISLEWKKYMSKINIDYDKLECIIVEFFELVSCEILCDDNIDFINSFHDMLSIDTGKNIMLLEISNDSKEDV